jgi:two-component system response regulator AtoC
MVEVANLPKLPEDVVFGITPQMLRIRRQLDKLANSGMPLLITGASGTGKEVLSRLIHSYSACRRGLFLKVHCPAIAGTRLGRELFANPPESRGKRRRVSATLFLDEIGELDSEQQAELLQALSSDVPCCRGGREDVAFRLVSASSLDLAREVEAGQFDPALYRCVSALMIRLPTLAERRADIPMLIDFFLDCFARSYGGHPRPFSQEMMRTLECYRWPGNIREMENLVKLYVICGSEEKVQEALQPPARRAEWRRADLAGTMRAPVDGGSRRREIEVIIQALYENRWDLRAAARELDMTYRGLLSRVKSAGLGERQARTSGREGSGRK